MALIEPLGGGRVAWISPRRRPYSTAPERALSRCGPLLDPCGEKAPKGMDADTACDNAMHKIGKWKR